MGSASDHRPAGLLQRELSLAQVWRWWVEELASLFPRGGARPWRGTTAVLCWGDDGWVAYRDNGRRREEVARLATGGANEPGARLAFAERLRRHFGRDCRPIVELPADRALVRSLSLPATAEATLGELLVFEIERQTPFPAGQASFYHQIVGRLPPTPTLPAGSIEVRLTAVPRQLVEAAQEALADLGLEAEAIVVEGLAPAERGRLSLLQGRATIATDAWTPRNRWLAGLVGALALAAALSQPVADEIEARRLADEARRLAPAAKAALAERTAADSARLTLAQALAARGQAPATVELLVELTRALPDDTWLGFLSLSGRELLIEGSSRSAAGLVAPIEASPLFGRVSFRAPVTRDSGSALERFQLAIEVKEKGR
jgi:general secretion pathway protein L